MPTTLLPKACCRNWATRETPTSPILWVALIRSIRADAMRKTCAVVAVLAASWLMFSLAMPAADRAACANGKEISFKQDVLPALQESCLACRYAKEQWPGLDLST